MRSTSCNRCSEDVGIEPIVVAELKLREVERHIFGRHFVDVPTTPRLKIDQKPSMAVV
jgi:hypothetical protein